MNKTLSILFCLSCFATAYQSNALLGAGMWFYIIVITGSFVAVSQFIQSLRAAGVALAMLLSVVSVLAVIFGYLASTIGGSSKTDTQAVLLLVFFGLIALFGFALVKAHRKEAKENPPESM